MKHAFFVLLCAFLIVVTSQGQDTTTTGAISAKVVDATGAIWPDAQVALIDTKTLEVFRRTADKFGIARFRELPPGAFVLVAAPGKRVDCIDSAVKQFHLKRGHSLALTLTLRLEHCGVVE